MKGLVFLFLTILWLSCSTKPDLFGTKPTIITEKVPHDSDDPAIWVNREDPEKSIVFGTDKDELNGGVYAFDLDGRIIPEKSITHIKYPNNVDIAYDFRINDSTLTDIMVFTEREQHQIRVFAVPSMTPLDNGGFKVFEDEASAEVRRPMGVAFYKDPETGKTYVIVSRKNGPLKNYLYQYELKADNEKLKCVLVRKFGNFSGTKEIEAIAVDHALGFVYYSDEGSGIRKYYADPSKGSEEISVFGGKYFKDDIEGIALAAFNGEQGFLIVSNQQGNSFNIFSRIDNSFVKTINLGTLETDGCDVTTFPLGNKFPKGLFVSMNNQQNFYYHSLDSLDLDH